MTTFNRSGHWRTNAQGTTFWVSGHDVSRDDWAALAASAAAPRPASALSASDALSRNVTVPNASCPVCGATVFFFKSADGGRVFFDPPLGPPWPKHPCTISERAKVVEASDPWGNTPEVDEDVVGFSVHPRASGTVLGLHSPEGTTWATADLDMRRTYFERVWPEFDADGTLRAVHLMSDTLDPERLDAAPCSEPGPITAADRIELSRGRVDDCLATLRRIGGIKGRVTGFSPDCGGFAVGMLGRARVAVLFAAVDVTDEEEHVDDDALADVATRWNAVRTLLAAKGKAPGDYLELDQLVVVTDDPLGRRETWYDESGSTTVHGALQSLGEYTHWEANKILDAARVGAVTFAAAGHAPQAPVEPIRMTCDEAIRHDEAFCEARWGGSEGGRWSCVRQAIQRLGRSDAFGMADALLKKAGWRVNHETSHPGPGREHWLDVVYIRPDMSNRKPGPLVRIHYELTATRGALVMVALGLKTVGQTSSEPIEAHLHLVRTREDVAAMTAAIGLPMAKRLLD